MAQSGDANSPAAATQAASRSRACILTLNGGSSTIKFAAFTAGDPPGRLWDGQVERIGEPDAAGADRSQLIDQLAAKLHGLDLRGIGHRVVHGGIHLIDHQPITHALLAQLRQAQPLDLAHLPREIALIESVRQRFPGVPQFACFDTAFHRDLPRVAQLLPIPRHYLDAGVRRFGFHGLSYAYLLQELKRQAGAQAAHGRIILAHLGSGASMVALHRGKPLDTTMAFTPTAGLVMGTRPGDLDPGLLLYLMHAEKMSAAQMDELINRQCGLLGVSQTSADMRDLISRRDADPRAAEAVELFCYQARKWIGAYAAVLGGLDTVVFAGGIGEHSPQVRAGICDGLGFLGIKLARDANAVSAAIISVAGAAVTVRIMHTDEEQMIAQSVQHLLSLSQGGGS